MLEWILTQFTGLRSGVRPRQHHWDQLHAALGWELPADFRSFINTTGGRPMGHQFGRLDFYNPGSTGFLSLTKANLARFRSGYEMPAEHCGLRLFPDDFGMVPLAQADKQCLMLDYGYEGQEVLLVDFSLIDVEVQHTKLPFADLIRNIYDDRAAFGGLGHLLWEAEDSLFEPAGGLFDGWLDHGCGRPDANGDETPEAI